MNESNSAATSSPNPLVTPPPLSKRAIFWRRLTSSTILWAVVVAVLFSPNKLVSDTVFIIALLAIAALGLAEFFSLVDRRGLASFKKFGIVAGLIFTAGTFATLNVVPGRSLALAKNWETIFLIIFVLALCLRQLFSTRNPHGLQALATTLLGLIYVPWLLNFVQWINYYPFPDYRSGHLYLLFFIAVTKFSDLGAYVVGSLCGRHKMIPRISPGKTWEGFVGALLVSTLISLMCVYFWGDRLVGLTYAHAVVLGVFLGAAAVLGDLVESLFKREAGVKDSGRFFPGIGGMLDLVDSLLFNGPIMYLYLRHVLAPI